MKRRHFDKLCKELEQWEIIEESLGMLRLTGKFRNLLVKNFPISGVLPYKFTFTETNLDESIILSILDITGSAEKNQLADYCCIIKGTLPCAVKSVK